MHKIDTETAVDGEFVSGSSSTGQQATKLNASWFNSVQRELVNLLEKNGVSLSRTNDQQLYELFKSVISGDFGDNNAIFYKNTEGNNKSNTINYSLIDIKEITGAGTRKSELTANGLIVYGSRNTTINSSKVESPDVYVFDSLYFGSNGEASISYSSTNNRIECNKTFKPSAIRIESGNNSFYASESYVFTTNGTDTTSFTPQQITVKLGANTSKLTGYGLEVPQGGNVKIGTTELTSYKPVGDDVYSLYTDNLKTKYLALGSNTSIVTVVEQFDMRRYLYNDYYKCPIGTVILAQNTGSSAVNVIAGTSDDGIVAKIPANSCMFFVKTGGYIMPVRSYVG